VQQFNCFLRRLGKKKGWGNRGEEEKRLGSRQNRKIESDQKHCHGYPNPRRVQGLGLEKDFCT